MEMRIDVHYGGKLVGKHFLDLVVANSIILELKTVESLSRAHYAQVRSYLKASGLRSAFLINFVGTEADFRRINGHR